MASKRKGLPGLSPEQKRFQSNAKKILRDVAAYVADGGDVLTHSATEMKFYKRRDALYPLMRKLGLVDDPFSQQLEADVQSAVAQMHDAARVTRQRGYDSEIARLTRLEHEASAKMSGYDKELRAMRLKRGGS